MSTFTEFLNLLQTNLYKFNLDRSKSPLKSGDAPTHHVHNKQHGIKFFFVKINNKINLKSKKDHLINDDINNNNNNNNSNTDTESESNDEIENKSLLKHISTKMHLAETGRDYDRFFNSSNKLAGRMSEARFKKYFEFIALIK